MSANNVTTCQACVEIHRKQVLNKTKEHLATYGVLSVEEFLADAEELKRIADDTPHKRAPTFGEYYELGINAEGRFRLDYTGTCDVCGFRVEVDHVDNLADVLRHAVARHVQEE